MNDIDSGGTPLHPTYPFVAPTPEQLDGMIVERLKRAINPDTRVIYGGKNIALREIPTPIERSLLGYGHQPTAVRVFEALPHPYGKEWAYTPETCCLGGESLDWVWIDPLHLVCPGCGLEGT
jgi:hypothetical protein